jgi:hypothetical protein
VFVLLAKLQHVPRQESDGIHVVVVVFVVKIIIIFVIMIVLQEMQLNVLIFASATRRDVSR